MAASDQHYRNQKTLDIVFAVSCILMLISTLWMFVQDYNREFKHVQREFRDVESTLNERAMLARLPNEDEVNSRLKDVEAARKDLTETQDKLAKKARDIQAKRDIQDAKARSLKADFDAQSSYLVITRDELSKANEAQKAALEKKKADQEKEVKTLGDKLAEAVKKLEDIDADYRKEIRAELAPKEEKLSNAEDSLKKQTAEFDRFAKATALKSWKFGDTFRNLPILDALASPTRIHQIVLPELTIDYNFKDVPRYDRCMTCHQGIDRGMFDRDTLSKMGYAPEDLSKRLETALKIFKDREKAGETLGFDVSDLPSKVRTKKLTRGQVTMYAAHPRLDLFVDANSPHSSEKFGCTICHGGQGSATEFVLASHTPADAHQEHAWQTGYDWKANHDWDFPMMSSRFKESGCIKCHHEVTDLVRYGSKEEAPKVTRGYDLVRDNGCFGCHEIAGTKGGKPFGPDVRLEPTPPLEWLSDADQVRLKSDPLNPPGTNRKVGPSLRRLSEKTNQEWTRKWIASPRGFREDTKMPHFYGLSTNRDEVLPDDQKGFPAAEMHAIAFYLLSESKAHLKADDTYRKALLKLIASEHEKLESHLLTDRERKDLAEVTKALTDLALLSMPSKASDIDAVGADVRQNQDRLQELYRKQTELETAKKSAKEDDADTIQKSLDDVGKDISAVNKELAANTKKLIDLGKPIPIADKVQTVDGGEASLKVLDTKESAESVDKGRKLFTEKGCLACHSHEGTESRGKTSVAGEANFGPNLSRMAAKLKPEAGNDARRWLYQWILNPNIHHPRTKMPFTRLEEAEARDIADWLLSQKGKDYDEKDPASPDNATLRRLARVYLAKAPGITRVDVEKIIPESGEIGFEEDRLNVLVRDAEERRLKKGATDDDLKWYIGKKSISRLGCFACHDVPGFETAKPIGTALHDWGRKDAERLAFEDADSYVRETYNIVPERETKKQLEERIHKLDRASRVNALQAKLKKDEDSFTDPEKWELIDLTKPDPGTSGDPMDPANLKARTIRDPLTGDEQAELKELRERLDKGPFWEPGKEGQMPYEKHFYEALEHHTREGFLHQKLVEPRSYDFNRTRAWDDRLRMPQFQFARIRQHPGESDADFAIRKTEQEAVAREAVMTFILGLTAERISGKFLPKPAPERLAEVKGRQVLEKFNCIGCHQARSSVFEFKLTDDERLRLRDKADKSAKEYAKEKFAFANHNAWVGVASTFPDRLTAIGNFDPGYNPVNLTPEPSRNGHLVDSNGNYSIRLNEALRFIDPSGLTRDLPAAESISVAPADLVWLSDAYGGKFVELMVPYLLKDPKYTTEVKVPNDARNLLPPPLHREGERVQPNWLYQFLLNPKTVRPHVILNMPRFNMSHEEATALVEYFGAVEKLTNPAAGSGTAHLAIPQHDDKFWHDRTIAYVASLGEKRLGERFKALEPKWTGILQERLRSATSERADAQATFDATKEEKDKEAAEKVLNAAKKRVEILEKSIKDHDYKEPESEYKERDAYGVDSYRLLTNLGEKGGACAKCHTINGRGEKKGPFLDLAEERLRPEWTKRWIANPQAMFAYDTVMPKNLSKKPAGQETDQEFFAGPPLSQVGALRDVLMDLSKISGLPANRFYHQAPPAGGK